MGMQHITEMDLHRDDDNDDDDSNDEDYDQFFIVPCW